MEQCTDKSPEPGTDHKDGQVSEQYNWQKALDEASKIQLEAEALIDEDNLLDAYYKYRACYWIMQKVLEKCPAAYKPDAIDSVKFAKSKVEGLYMLLKSKNLSSNKITSAEDAGLQSSYFLFS